MNNNYNLAPFDALRGIAILSVFIFHIAEVGAFKSLPLLHNFFLTGWLGVDLFFAISGFLITRSAINLLSKSNYYQTFYTNRARRILPAYFSTLIILIISFNFFYRNTDALALFNTRIPCLVMLCTNMETALTSIATPFGVNHFWSLAVEVQIYLIWPIIVSNLSRQKLLIFSLALALFSFSYRIYVMYSTENWVFIYFSTITRLDSFALGSAAFLISEKNYRHIVSYIAICTGLIGLAITATINSGIPYSKVMSNVFGITFAALFSSGLVLALTTRKNNKSLNILNNKHLINIGIISYSFYILHFPIMGSKWFAPFNNDWGTFGMSIQKDIAITAALFSLCLCAAALNYHLVEKKFFLQGAKKVNRPIN